MTSLLYFDINALPSVAKEPHLSDGGASQDAIDTLLCSSLEGVESELSKWLSRYSIGSRNLAIVIPFSLVGGMSRFLAAHFPQLSADIETAASIMPGEIAGHLSKIAGYWNVVEERIWFMPRTVKDFWVDRTALVIWDEGRHGLPTVGDAWLTMRENRKGHLPLVNRGKLTGLITWSSIQDLIPLDTEFIGLQAHNEEYIDRLRMQLEERRVLRSSELVTVDEDCSVVDLLRAFTKSGTRFPSLVPVLDKDRQLLSVVSWVDLFGNFELLKQPRVMPTAETIGLTIDANKQVIKADHSVQVALQKVETSPVPYILVVAQDGAVLNLLSDRDIANWKSKNHIVEDDEIHNKVLTTKSGEVRAKHALGEITVDPKLPLWARNGNSLIKTFLDSVEGDKSFSDRIGCLVVPSQDYTKYKLITPHDCLRVLLK